MTQLDTVTGFGKWACQPKQPPEQGHGHFTRNTKLNAIPPSSSCPPLPQLPLEVWSHIFCWLYPSQLKAVAAVSRTWCNLVQRHQVWRFICTTANLADHYPSQDNCDWVPDHFALVQEKSKEICEMCFEHSCESLHSYLLPVGMNSSTNSTDSTVIPTDTATTATMLPVATMESPVPDTVIQMCRPCRIEYYAKHPEPIPSRLLPFFWGENDSYKVISRIDVLTAMIVYGLSPSAVRTLPSIQFVPLRSSSLVPGQNGSRSLFQESDILQLARQTRGGDVGIASYKSASKRTCWVFSDLKDDAVKRRQVLLRSLLYDKRLPLRPRSNVCNMFVQSGHGDPVEIVKELDVEDWLKCCTNYNSAIKEVTHQIRLRPNGHNSARQASFQKKSKGQPNDDAEEDKEWHKLVELDRWLMRRLYNANFHSYKLDPEGPMKPPEAIWPMLDSLDMGQNALDYAAHTVARSLRKEKSRKIDYELGLGFEDMDELDMSVDQVRKIIDDTTTTMTADQSSENEGPVRTLSMLLEDELGLSWDRLVVQRVKNLLQSIGTSV